MGYLLSLQPTFTQGLVLGQLSILFLLALVLKYLFLVSHPSPAHHSTTLPANAAQSKQGTAPRQHTAESTVWLNVVLQEILQTYRSELRDNRPGPDGDESARSKIERQLNRMRPPSFVDPVVVHSVDLGSSAPHLSNARVHESSHDSQQQVEFDVTYADTASISLSTSVLFNYPLPYFARLPLSLTLSLSLFSSEILLTPPHPTSDTPTLTLALPPRFTLDLHISSLLGSRAKLADVPKLHDMIESQIKKTLASHGTWTIVLPGIARPQGDAHTRSTGDEIDVKLVNDGLGRPPDILGLGALNAHHLTD